MMMKKLAKKERQQYRVNLATAESDGSFLCPKCELKISPDDQDDDNYEILDTIVENNELAELWISCGKCNSKIVITGFQIGDS